MGLRVGVDVVLTVVAVVLVFVVLREIVSVYSYHVIDIKSSTSQTL